MRQKLTLNFWLFSLLALLLLTFALIVPPLQKPDEEVHFYRALNLASGNFTCPKPTGNFLMLNGQFVYLINEVHRLNLPLHQNNKFEIALYQRILTNNYQLPDNKRYNTDYQCNYPLVSFVPQAIGILIAKAMSPNPLIIFFTGRVAIAIVAFIWMVVLYRKINRQLQPLLLVTYFTPVLLQQVTAYSYDGIHILLALSIFMFLVNRSKNILGLFVMTLSLLLAKPGGYELMALSIFTLPLHSLTKNKKEYLLKVTIFFGTLIIFYGLTRLVFFSSYTSGTRLKADVSPLINWTFLVHQPLNFIWLLARTSITRLMFYVESTIGVLGWLEYSIGLVGYLAYALLLGYAFLTTRVNNLKAYTKINIAFIGSIILGTYIIIHTLFFLLWTPLRSIVIEGVQGRYFLPLLPLVYLSVVLLRQHFFPNLIREYKKTITLVFALLITLATIFTVVARYY